MIPLPETFRSKGFTYKQIWREGRVILLSKTKPAWESPRYEVVVIQECKERVFPNGDVVPDHEAMPSSESWGTHGWSPTTREAAEAKFKEVSARHNAPG